MRIPERYKLKGSLFEVNGSYSITYNGVQFYIIASDGLGWEHVSVSSETRCPRWDEMCYIKNLFWDEDQTVIQYHPAKEDYVNYHKNCLHLWRPKIEFPIPPTCLI